MWFLVWKGSPRNSFVPAPAGADLAGADLGLETPLCRDGRVFPRRTRLRGTIPDIAMLFGFQPLKDFFLSRSMELDAHFFSPSASQQCALGKNKAK